MKLIYKKAKIFPSWVKFKGTEPKETYYALQNDAVECKTDSIKLPYYNHIEMSGFEMSAIISYKVDNKKQLCLNRFCVFPQIRVIPNETRGSLTYNFKKPDIKYGSEVFTDKIKFDGTLTFFQHCGDMKITHTISSAYNKKALIEKIVLSNNSSAVHFVDAENKNPYKRINKVFLLDNYEQKLYTTISCDGKILNTAKISVEPNSSKTIYICNAAEKLDEKEIEEQFNLRKDFLKGLYSSCMEIKTPDEEINLMTNFCKIRACESIFKTKNGLMHSPGGGNFYGALWTNDQCEYANPLFAYLGYKSGKEQSINSYRLFSKFASSEKAIPTSIIACGDGIWNGAGDRGDSSMFLYGISRYLLSTGDKNLTAEFMPSITAAQKYVVSKINAHGVVESDSDELENRFESGNANLSTSCITYDAFISLYHLYKELNENQKAEKTLNQAKRIKDGIENYFAFCVEGYETYRYCKEEKHLRSWICLPLVMGIFDRKEQTIKALMSDKLFTGRGLLTRSGQKTYWDRSLLYSLRGMFYADKANKAYSLLKKYTNERLLGFHAPYPVEAFPEGNSAQLSAESALYLRIFTEGILGYRPVGFNSFEIQPSLPDKWEFFEVKNIELCGRKINISIKNGDYYTVKINDDKIVINKGEKRTYTLG